MPITDAGAGTDSGAGVGVETSAWGDTDGGEDGAGIAAGTGVGTDAEVTTGSGTSGVWEGHTVIRALRTAAVTSGTVELRHT